MVKCPNCGEESESNFCPNCGEKLEAEITCPHCQAKIEAGSLFCSECGEKIGQCCILVGKCLNSITIFKSYINLYTTNL